MEHRPLLEAGSVQANSSSDGGGSSSTSVQSKQPRVASVPGAIFNMSNSILGGGISLLALPSAVASAGPALFLVLLVGSGVATVVSAQLLAEAAEHARVTTYDGLGARALGNAGSTAVMVFIFLNNFGVCISFLQGFGDVVPELVQQALALHHHHEGNTTLMDGRRTGSEGVPNTFGPFFPPPPPEQHYKRGIFVGPITAGLYSPSAGSDAGASIPLGSEGGSGRTRSILTLLLLVPLLPVMVTLTRIEHRTSAINVVGGVGAAVAVRWLYHHGVCRAWGSDRHAHIFA
jgi:hypothetical protein